ncbi:hypothetical protein MNBD_GAMMA22-2729 [hydrothermal vent metagenome]|uniref:DUF1415 domain-containing protein n=1 Tax=hydrothermal vent metagenome TaxID=652676 RepID=A0A3B0ZDG1_9ZZZZ
MTASADNIIKQTQSWISSVIIEFNFCPFAKREFERGSIYYKIASDLDSGINQTQKNENTILASALEDLIKECYRLDSSSKIETSFLILPKNFSDYSLFLDLSYLAEELLTTENYEGIYQIASFHPDYCFADTAPDDAANFTNKAPYPMLHLLRESSMEQALDNYSNPEQIPLRNIKKSRELGIKKFQTILTSCIKQN